jgi:hypothetical protein
MSVLLRSHWYFSGALPLASTVNVAVCPVARVTLCGAREMTGLVTCGV